ncbi:hypothetical protein FHS43_006155 [Streptosporangium becharense]|uniref:Uncharacterized protein n=1 Tax=Streptosporangium becharense TaxID=1816182 RepID=A0A7W9MH98_9ACTN|nr:hypothetical protein [Streptosporangium becharense]MBB2914843.1 hypothetical protein [Streptosporangium becharense]MBB5820346.1 hypothetical protein [Streptosporangium becharense]
MGVRLLFDRFDDIQGRIDIGDVRQAGDTPGYDDGAAVVPQENWTALGEEEAERLRPDAETPPGMTLELVSQDLPVFASDDLQGRVDAAAALDPLNGRWPRRRHVYTRSPAGLLTSTEDTAVGRRIGLHVDNWDRLPYPARQHSRRRLCINFGPGIRYLLVGDRDVMEICRVLGRDREQHCPHTDDVRRYVADGHPLRCLRIRLEPGQGYIAPTELAPHDGSTSGAQKWSLAAFWLG